MWLLERIAYVRINNFSANFDEVCTKMVNVINLAIFSQLVSIVICAYCVGFLFYNFPLCINLTNLKGGTDEKYRRCGWHVRGLAWSCEIRDLRSRVTYHVSHLERHFVWCLVDTRSCSSLAHQGGVSIVGIDIIRSTAVFCNDDDELHESPQRTQEVLRIINTEF